MAETVQIKFEPLWLPIETGRYAEWYDPDMVGVCTDAFANEVDPGEGSDGNNIYAWFAGVEIDVDLAPDGITAIAGPFPTREDAYKAALGWSAGFGSAELVWNKD